MVGDKEAAKRYFFLSWRHSMKIGLERGTKSAYEALNLVIREIEVEKRRAEGVYHAPVGSEWTAVGM